MQYSAKYFILLIIGNTFFLCECLFDHVYSITKKEFPAYFFRLKFYMVKQDRKSVV